MTSVDQQVDYDRLNIDPPSVAYQRALQHAKDYNRGHWPKRWWRHPVEAKATVLTGIFQMRNPVSGLTEKTFQRHYEATAAEMSRGRRLYNNEFLQAGNLPPSLIRERCDQIRRQLEHKHAS